MEIEVAYKFSDGNFGPGHLSPLPIIHLPQIPI